MSQITDEAINKIASGAVKVKRRFMNMVYLTLKQFQDPYYQGFASQIAFGFMMSIIPLVILLSYVLSVVNVSEEVLYNLIGQYLTGETADYLLGLIMGRGGSGGLTIALILSALYGASKSHYSLACIANHMSSTSESKNFFIERGRAVINSMVTIATIAVALILLVYGEPLLKLSLELMVNSELTGALSEVVTVEITTIMESTAIQVALFLRWPLMLFIFFMVLSLNFYVLPTVRAPFKTVVPGGIFASIGLLVVTDLFSTYTTNIANYNVLYGAAGALVALMFWFYLISWVLVLGLVFNESLRASREDKTNLHFKDLLSTLIGKDPLTEETKA